MRNTKVLLALLLLFSCARPDLKLIDATRQSWSAGPAGKGSGTLYEFMVQVKTKEPLVFDSIWVDGEYLACKTLRSLDAQNRLVQKNDSVVLSATLHTGGPVKHYDEEQPESPKKNTVRIDPVMKVEALILYKKAGLRKYFKIDSVTTLSKIIMP